MVRHVYTYSEASEQGTYENYREGNILGPEAVSLVERSSIQCPFLGGSTVRGSTQSTVYNIVCRDLTS